MALFAVSLKLAPRHALSHLIWSVPPLVSLDAAIWTYGAVVTSSADPLTAPDARQPSTGLLKPTAACAVLQPLLLLATHECGLAVGPLDGPAADLADGEFRVVIAERTSSQVVGDQEGVAVAATPTCDQPCGDRPPGLA